MKKDSGVPFHHHSMAAWNYIVWGLLNCLVLLVSQEFNPLYRKFHEKCAFSNTRFWDGIQILRTFLLMGMIRILDVYRDVPLTFRMVGSIFTTPNWGAVTDGSFLKLGINPADYVVAALGFLALFVVSLLRSKGTAEELLEKRPVIVRYGLLLLLILCVVTFGAYGIGYDASQFIYNQF